MKEDVRHSAPGAIGAGADKRKPPASGGRFRHVFAALDLGTNNCRLLVARAEHEAFTVLDSFSRTVRLGEGLAQNGELSEKAQGRAIEAVKICVQKMRRHGVSRSCAIATAACRAARNGRAFIQRLKRETGIAFEIIAPAEEAKFAVAGCQALIDEAAEGAVVFDIGGGSTELIWLTRDPERPRAKPNILKVASVPIGVVTLAERIADHPIEPSAYPALLAGADAAFGAVELPTLAELGLIDRPVHLLGTSGTVTTIAGIHLDLPRYDRARVDGAWLPLEEARAIIARVARMTFADRLAFGCIGKDRADLILPGCAIFEAIARRWPTARVRVADRGLREGMLLAMMEKADGEGRRRRSRGGRRHRRRKKAKVSA
ncbi:MAG: Ppx/GppA family phosphatase [Alphaproteobacteria bacterium]|nr:Ppx/GppA family phosphatase [Alphaproteobacteria bacterium]